MPYDRPNDWEPTDWSLVAHALAQWAGDPRDCDDQAERAYELIEGIADENDVPPSALVDPRR